MSNGSDHYQPIPTIKTNEKSTITDSPLKKDFALQCKPIQVDQCTQTDLTFIKFNHDDKAVQCKIIKDRVKKKKVKSTSCQTSKKLASSIEDCPTFKNLENFTKKKMLNPKLKRQGSISSTKFTLHCS